MSLTFEEIEGVSPIANYYKGEKIDKTIYAINDDEIKEGEKALTKIRINVENDSFFPYISDSRKTAQTQRIYACGGSGVGKTTFIIAYIINFHKKFPKSKILFFSSKKEDKNIDSFKFVERVRIDEDMLESQYSLSEISNNSNPTLTIFDDCEDFPSKKLTKEIDRLLHEILRNGRSYGIYCLYTHHQASDYKATRTLIYEATHCIIFPKRSAKNTYDYFMEKKMNLNKKTINLINTLKSNYVCIKREVPQCVISDKYILLL